MAQDVENQKRQLMSSINSVVTKINEIRKFPKEKDVVLSRLERSQSPRRFSPEPVPWHYHYPELNIKSTFSPKALSNKKR